MVSDVLFDTRTVMKDASSEIRRYMSDPVTSDCYGGQMGARVEVLAAALDRLATDMEDVRRELDAFPRRVMKMSEERKIPVPKPLQPGERFPDVPHIPEPKAPQTDEEPPAVEFIIERREDDQ